MNNLLTHITRKKTIGRLESPIITRVSGGVQGYQQFEKVISLPPDPPRDDDGVVLNLIFDNQWSKEG
jgi:hypothetical protein